MNIPKSHKITNNTNNPKIYQNAYETNNNFNPKLNKTINIIDFFFFEDYSNIITIKETKYNKNDLKNKIFLFFDKEGKIVQNLYNINDFKDLYFFIKINPQTENAKPIGLVFSQKIINDNRNKNINIVIINEIRNSKLIKEMNRYLKVDIIKDNIELEEDNSSINNQNLFQYNFILKKSEINDNYIFLLKGLNNIGSTCYMNATLQCLLHVSELIHYFINEYPNDRVQLKQKNIKIETKGQISDAFCSLINSIFQPYNNMNDSINLNAKTSINKKASSKNNSLMKNNFVKDSVSPYNFKSVLGFFNPQFKKLEANDSKDLILYLLQIMHEELNYFGDNNSMFNSQPNQHDRALTFNFFMNNYNSHNFSIISNLFYGTYETITKCDECNKIIYNFQKFEFISFSMYNYKGKKFEIINGFKDNEKEQELKGNNQYYCNNCKKLTNARIICKIIQPPNKLLINIDYGKNKKYKPSKVLFDETIDITDHVSFNFFKRIKYNIISVCSHQGYSGKFGHYIAFCRNRQTNKWYLFNDSFFKECTKEDIYSGSPYLLLYEKVE